MRLTKKRSTSRGRRAAAVVGALALTLLVVARASAHDTWLMGASNSGKVGSPLRLDLTSGELFPNDDFAIEANRVSRAQVREGHFTRSLPSPTATAQTLRYIWVPKTPGVSTIGIELQPKVLTLAPKLIEEYLGEIDADSGIRATWKSLGDNQKWTESYTKHAMTFARITPARPDSNWMAEKAWRKPMGLGLELVPERDPTALRGGDTLVVRVLARGVAVAGFSVGAIREGRSKAEFFRTDAAGRARVVLDRGGRWLLNGTKLRRSTTGATVWESDFVTATLHVAPRP
jgi:uncharacterized GH25 family protein